ncbi:hypothetical protein AVEN_32501-1 [Araneus ventricosus]|uniref:Uncharacterized protein n=1 Tax=Araneus ventricosus TaxID=182803 RepID=A0A4Y2VRX6_ARAVE|nr:hypothetical protein AVEN_32501-1 [Araneus ventricosus]
MTSMMKGPTQLQVQLQLGTTFRQQHPDLSLIKPTLLPIYNTNCCKSSSPAKHDQNSKDCRQRTKTMSQIQLHCMTVTGDKLSTTRSLRQVHLMVMEFYLS